jgi:uncharacterized membrane protein
MGSEDGCIDEAIVLLLYHSGRNTHQGPEAINAAVVVALPSIFGSVSVQGIPDFLAGSG